ncbi:putative metallopeptidase family M24 [Microthyrium microscopicum]|uniref:Xaa-Pro aminopeptidase n=1 Tax=Microthyrium microscopicum TaxID=703497 RepID=A0A6A6UDB8_9PEZI|nr:putative metallopeptidase family M24 [Microthyrium microscopicum]
MRQIFRVIRPVIRNGVRHGKRPDQARWFTQSRRCMQVSAADLQFGQPVHETHPHLLKAGELTRGITALEYYQRRQKLAALLPEKSIAILAAADVKYRSGPVFYPFHQNTDFFYLTGFQEPEAVAIIDKRSSEPVFHLLVREKDAQAELWEGARSGTQAAMDVFNADESGDVTQLSTLLPKILDGATNVYTNLQHLSTPDSSVSRFFNSTSKDSKFSSMLGRLNDGSKLQAQSLEPLMSEIRVLKSQAEVAVMRKAGQISGRVLTDAMRQPWETEKDLHAFLDYQFRIKGCDSEAYVPVVASGKNALGIHYVRNDEEINDGSMILTDAGGSYGGYITDITRTWPNSGKFTDLQRDLYETVLQVQRSCVALCREDANLSLDEIHNVATRSLKDGLKRLNFDVSGNAMDILFPHHLGHHIGLDVHDCRKIPRRDKLKDGMCVTIEPGIYVPDNDRWPAWFRGMGIRIEDSICVTKGHPLVLTTEAVKEVVDIEALRH